MHNPPACTNDVKELTRLALHHSDVILNCIEHDNHSEAILVMSFPCFHRVILQLQFIKSLLETQVCIL